MKKLFLYFAIFAIIAVLFGWMYSSFLLPDEYSSFGQMMGIKLKYLWSPLGWLWGAIPTITAILLLFVTYGIVFLAPLSVIASFRTRKLEKKYHSGESRTFAGSWISFILGLLIMIYLIYYYASSPSALLARGFLGNYCLLLLLIGYPLYYWAWDVYDAEGAVAARNKLNHAIWGKAGSYSYTETTYADGRKTSDEGVNMFISYLIPIVMFIFTTFFMPVFTYLRLINMYLIPVFRVDNTWEYLFSSSLTAEPIQGAAIVQKSFKGIDADTAVYAKWDDGFYYMATIRKDNGDNANIIFFDKVKSQVSKSDIFRFAEVTNEYKAYGNYNNEGNYYPCVIEKTEKDAIEVVYDEDGIRETLAPYQLRFFKAMDLKECMYAKYSADGYYYVANVDKTENGKCTVTFFDGFKEKVSKNHVIPFVELVEQAKPYGNWEGSYYPCVITKMDENGILHIVYDEDGVVSVASPQLLRFLKTIKTSECIFAKYSEDGYYYMATVDSVNGDTSNVTFFDGVQEKVKGNNIGLFDELVDNMKPYGNWKGAGSYYPCAITNISEDGFADVVYDQDGVRERLSLQGLRLK